MNSQDVKKLAEHLELDFTDIAGVRDIEFGILIGRLMERVEAANLTNPVHPDKNVDFQTARLLTFLFHAYKESMETQAEFNEFKEQETEESLKFYKDDANTVAPFDQLVAEEQAAVPASI